MPLYPIAVGLSILIKVVALYFAITGLFALRPRKPVPERAPKTRFAVLLPARNEEAVIGRTVSTLQIQQYPRELYDIFVIPNNCTDQTEAVARASGAKLLFCDSPVTCKGDALHQAMEQLMDGQYDAFCIFDADNQVDPQFLSRMNDAFLNGAQVAKGRNEAANPYASWVSGCYALYFNTYNLFYNQARENLGLSAMLVGTGFAVSRNFLRSIGGWNTVTITEDAEFASICAQQRVRIHWVPDAVTYDEQPTGFRTSMTQRRRWCSGVMQVARNTLPKLWADGFHPLKLDHIVFLLAPITCVVALIPDLITTMLFGVSTGLLFGVCAYLALVLGISLMVLVNGSYRPAIIKSILLFPLFTLSWLPLQILALFRKTTTWKPIVHKGHELTFPLPHMALPR